MNEMDDIGEEMLFAYLDGELDAAQRARVEAAAARDPRLAALLAQQQRLKTQLQTQFAAVLDEPVPERLLRAAAAPVSAPVTDLDAVRAARGARRWALPEWSAVAATLVLGLLVGLNLRGTGRASLVADADGLMIAAGPLAAALSDQPAGPLPGSAGSQIGFSFHATTGEYCRTFAMRGGQAGLACRRDARWVVDVLATGNAASPDTGAFRQAGSAMPEALRTAIEQRIAGEPLTQAEELARIGEQWRAAPAGDTTGNR